MKRFLSWIVMYIEYCIVILLVELLLLLVGEIFDFTHNFNIIVRLIIYGIFGSTFSGLLMIPFLYFPALLISGSDAICPSRTGKRYRVLSVIMLINNFLSLISYLYHREFFSMVSCLFMCIFCIILLIASKADS